MGWLTNLLVGKADDIEIRSEGPPEQPPPGSGVLPPPRQAESLTTASALSLSAVYRAVLILATSVSQLSLIAEKGDAPTPMPGWLKRPDLDMSRSAFLELTTTSMATTGNAYWRVTRNAREEVSNLRVLDPQRVGIRRNDSGDVIGYTIDSKDVSKSEIRHLALLRIPGQPEGLGPIQSARRDLGGALDLRNYASEYFENGSIPNGVLSTDQQLTDDMATRYKASFVNSVSGREPAVLGAGLDYSPILLAPRDAQFLESRQFSTTEIARLFGIPATYLLAAVEGNSMTYTNMETVDIAFVRYSLMAYIREIEEAFSSLLPRGTEARFNIEALLRSDTKSRYEAHKLAIEMGLYDAGHARRIEGIRD